MSTNQNLIDGVDDDAPITACISGKLPSGRKKEDYIVPLLAVGIELMDEVFAGLTYLVQTDFRSESSKSLRAKKLGVQIINESELIRLTDGLPILKIERSAEVKENLIKANNIRSKLISKLSREMNVEKSINSSNSTKHSFLRNLELSAEGFTPILTKTAISDADRSSSMLVGPFFTTEEYPIPCSSEGMLLPLIQLDLREISRLSNRDLGDSLLQLWIDPDWDASPRGMIRHIPREEVVTSNLTEFDYEIHLDAHQSPLPDELIYDPDYDSVNVISGYRSVGMQCQDSYFDVYAEELTEDVLNEIEKDLAKFKSLLSASNDLHFLGSFYPIQYSAVDMSMYCLVHFPMWAASGNAQIFYDCGDDWMVFDFQESLR
jgi:hypothetical protein